MNKVYQVIVVSKIYGIANVIPSPFAFTFEEDAMQSIRNGINTFEKNGEPLIYKGKIYTLGEVAELCKAVDPDIITNEAYILEVEVR